MSMNRPPIQAHDELVARGVNAAIGETHGKVKKPVGGAFCHAVVWAYFVGYANSAYAAT